MKIDSRVGQDSAFTTKFLMNKNKIIMEKFEELAFRRGLRRINEGGVNRIMQHGKHGFIIISANRSEIYSSDTNCDLTNDYLEYCETNNINPENEKIQNAWLSQRNNNADKELKEILKNSKYGFTPVYGGYHGSDNVVDSFEPSYIVYNHVKGGGAGDHTNFDELRKFGIELAKKFKQESVYIQEPDEAPNYVGQNGEQQNSGSGKNFKINRDDEMFYTTSKRDKDNPQRFTADIQFENMYRDAGPSTYFNRLKRVKSGEVFID